MTLGPDHLLRFGFAILAVGMAVTVWPAFPGPSMTTAAAGSLATGLLVLLLGEWVTRWSAKAAAARIEHRRP